MKLTSGRWVRHPWGRRRHLNVPFRDGWKFDRHIGGSTFVDKEMECLRR